MKHLFFISLLTLSLTTISQIRVQRSVVDYSLVSQEGERERIISFHKHKDSTIYTYFRYSSYLIDHQELTDLEKEISHIDSLWKIALDSISTDLRSVNVGYPWEYNDILHRHIVAMKNAPEWQEHVQKNGKKTDYRLTEKIMLREQVYLPMVNFLNQKGYKVVKIDSEKHGFLPKENLIALGFTGDEIIPVPYMVWLVIEKKQ